MTERLNGTTSKTSGASLTELASIISQETAKLDQYLKENNVPQPGFDVDSPLNFPKLPEEIQRARERITSASKAMADLTTGPEEGVRWLAWNVRYQYTFY